MKMQYKRIISIALALAVSAAPMLLASCGQTGDGNESSGDPQTTEEPNTTAEPETEPVTTEPPEKTLTLRVGTYNIKHGADAGGDLTLIGNVIKEAGLDICGLQEVDFKTRRVGGVDQPALLAKAAGMEYYKYTPAIDYQGGKYGTLILSRYPIEEFEYTTLYSGEKEGRAIGHAKINVDGCIIDFFNTHLSYEEKALRSVQFRAVRKMLAECEHYILTADFNTQDFQEFSALKYGSLVNSAEHRYVTFPKRQSAIDNIVLSSGFSIGLTDTVANSHSDHRMLWSELTLTYIPQN